MPRTKTRQRPAPRRTRASRKEVKVLIPGHALGAEACLVMRRKWGCWAVLDMFRGKPSFVGPGEVWEELKADTPETEPYQWTQGKAQALVAHFVEQAVQIHRNTMLGQVRRIESLAADMAPPEVMPLVLTPEQVQARLKQAEAEVASRAKRAAPVDEGISVPAAQDHPDYQPPRPDPAPDHGLLSLKAMGISANAEDETVGLPLLRIHGPEVTAQFPLPDAPPMPTRPPTIHLTEVSPGAGERAASSARQAVGAAAYAT